VSRPGSRSMNIFSNIWRRKLFMRIYR
jgi:hypothetical protein